MTQHWIVRHHQTGEEQLVQCEAGPPPYDPDTFDFAALPREIDTASERWDWATGAIACRFTPAEARDIMWERAKAYRELRRNAPLPVWGVLVDAPIVADCDLDSRMTIAGAVQMAQLMMSAGTPWTLTFTDHENAQHTLTGEQVIALGLNVATFHGLCHSASQAVRDTLDAALASGATADDIFAIDITAGYPDPIGAGDPPEGN